MKTKSIIAIVLLCSLSVFAQTNTPQPDLSDMVSNLQAQVAALQHPATNPPAPIVQSVTYSNGVPVATNALAAPGPGLGSELATEFSPITALLGGQSTKATTIFVWLSAISAVVAGFRTKIKHKIADALNTYAASASADQDQYLKTLFATKWYSTLAFALNFAGISLPTAADLDRTIAAQKEAVTANKQAVG